MSDDEARNRRKQQFNVYLPPELIRRAKYRALDDQISLSELVERALAQFLEPGDDHAEPATRRA